MVKSTESFNTRISTGADFCWLDQSDSTRLGGAYATRVVTQGKYEVSAIYFTNETHVRHRNGGGNCARGDINLYDRARNSSRHLSIRHGGVNMKDVVGQKKTLGGIGDRHR